MSKGILETVGGAALIAAGIFLEVVTFGASTPLTAMMITAGAGMVLSGIGTMLAKGPVNGFATTTRNPIAPWEVIYGRSRVGGTIVYIAEFGESNKFLDMVIVLAAHACQSVDEVLFDNQRLQIGANNTSFTPVQQNLDIPSTSDLQRVGSVVTIQNVQDIPLLTDGDRLLMEGIHPVSLGLNGIYQVFDVRHNFPTSGKCTFSYLCGGSAIPPATISESGRVHTQWQDYKKTVYLESIGDSGSYNRLGHPQALGETFVGMTNGTPNEGDTGDLIQNNANGNNPWTNFCSLVGMTAVHIRLKYDRDVYPGGIPQISFLVRGKNDIYDPRPSPPTFGYTENSALCIADYLSNTKWGFKYAYGTEISTPGLIAAANVCDEPVGLASPFTSPLTTEPRYTCNGHFQVSMKRGEVLQNLLTSCAGRIVPDILPIVIYPAAWVGTSLTLANNWVLGNAAGAIKWRSSVSVSNLYNGVKGTYISPANNWQSSDFPRYAQDSEHGYTNGSPADDYDLNLTNDGGDRRWLDIQLPFTISNATAQRLAKIELMRRRQQGTGTFLLNMAGYQIAPLDVLAMSLTYFGWNGKTLEVLASRFKLDKQSDGDKQVTLLGVEIDVQETDPTVYDWELIDELSPQGFQHPGIPNSVYTPDPPTNLKIVFDDSGNTVLTWTSPLDPYVTRIEGRYQPVASPPGIWISLGFVDNSSTQMPLPVLLPGVQYIVEIRAVNAAGVTSVWVSILYTPLPLPPQWMPYDVLAPATDALFPDERTFEVIPTYANMEGGQPILADGTALTRLNITGVRPVSNCIPDCDAPIITAATVSTTGGFIPGGIILYAEVTADDGAGNYTLPSAVFQVEVAVGTNTNSISLNVIWPDTFAGLTRYTVYASDHVDLICAQETGALTLGPASPPTSPPSSEYSPRNIILSGSSSSPPASPPTHSLLRSTWGPPNPNLRKLRAKATIGYHLGVLGAGIDQLPSAASPPSSPPAAGNQIQANACIDISGQGDWSGRALVIIGRKNQDTGQPVPFWSANITHFDPATGVFTLDRVITASVDDPQIGDAFIVTTKGYDNSGDPYRITDSRLSNSLNYNLATGLPTPHSGLTPDLEIGMVLRVIKGTGRGQKAKIIANSATTYVLETPITIGADSVWIVTESGWPYQVDSIPLDNSDPFRNITIVLPMDNFGGQSVFVECFLVDVGGDESEDGDGPFRMIYVFGAGLRVILVSSDTQLGAYDQQVNVDTSAGSVTLTLPPSAKMKGRRVIVKKISSDANQVTVATQTVNGTQQTIDFDTSLTLSAKGSVIEIAGNAD